MIIFNKVTAVVFPHSFIREVDMCRVLILSVCSLSFLLISACNKSTGPSVELPEGMEVVSISSGSF